MDADDRPEDERRDEGLEPEPGALEPKPEGLEPEADTTGEEPDDLGIFGLDRDAQAEEPIEDGVADAEDEIDTSGPGPPEHRALRVLVVLGGALAVVLFLVGWNRVATSDAFCASCHEVEPAVQASDRSVHADVSCLSCHTGFSGVLGALRYIPTLARETIDEFTGWDVAHGVLDPRSCVSCHDDLAATPELAAAHEDAEDCASCHGDVSHPPLRLPGFDRPVDELAEGQVHPRLYVQTHGTDVASDPGSCNECHETDFCETCHLRETYPHPDDWIETHGPTQIELGPDTCQGCHAPTFCEGCHGAEIPHDVRWMGEHWRDLQDAGTGPCLLCHPRRDCTDCHAKHQVHREQDLYV